MTARVNKVGNDDADSQKHDADDDNAPHRPPFDYYSVCNETDPFLDCSLLDPVDSHQHGDVVKAIQNMVDDAIDNGFPTDKLSKLRNIENKNINGSRRSCLVRLQAAHR